MGGYQLYKVPRVSSLTAGIGAGVAAGALVVAAGIGPFGGDGGTVEASIVGGGSAPAELEDPVALLSHRRVADEVETSRCTGSVIADRWVLTAAHCVTGELAGDPAVAAVVVHRGETHEVVDVVVHPAYRSEFVAADPDTTGAHHDVALVQVAGRLGGDHARLARPVDAVAWPVGAELELVGYGRTGTGEAVAEELLHATTRRTGDCSAWGAYVHDAMHLCTEAVPEAATCDGDSGGPVLLRGGHDQVVQVGIVSYGDVACGDGTPDVHVRVDAAVEWIESEIGPLEHAELDQGPAAGYWLVTDGGEITEFGRAPFLGDLVGSGAGTPVVDIAATATGEGYVVLDERGGLHGFGDAARFVAAPVDTDDRATALSMVPGGTGGWVVTDRGVVHAVGGAADDLGDLSTVELNGPIVDAVATASGLGYWMVAGDGGIFAFGDAAYLGSMGGMPLNAPIVSMTLDPVTGGYWMVGDDGGIFAFGGAGFHGSMGGVALNEPVRGMSPYGDGYVLFAADGGIFSFSDLPFAGSLGASPPEDPVVGVATAG